jgi:hypothetical protein
MMYYVALLQCVQCARTAEALGTTRLLILWQGMWVLLIPPLAVFCGILWFAWKRSRQADVGNASTPDMAMDATSRPTERL